MSGIARLPELRAPQGSHRAAARHSLAGYCAAAWRFRYEIVWGLLAAANYAISALEPGLGWEMFAVRLAWVGLTLLYGLRVWPMHASILALAAVMAIGAISIGFARLEGLRPSVGLIEIPMIGALFLVITWHDRRRVEAQRETEAHAAELRGLLERHERFIHDASHELRTPVTIARGHLELIRDSDSFAPDVEIALDELRRIDRIIERLLLLAKAGRPDFVRLERLEVEPFLEDVFMRWSDVAPRNWRLGEVVPGSLLVDPEWVRAALDALLENAVKYSAPYTTIELRARRAEPRWIVIEVQDEGCGVPADALDRIFERFARADAARTRTAGGVGLGLAIVDAIVKRHGGRCTARSTDRGSVFSLYFPVLPPPAGDRADTNPVPGAREQTTNGS